MSAFIYISATGELAGYSSDLQDRGLQVKYGLKNVDGELTWYEYFTGAGGWREVPDSKIPEETRGYLLLMIGTV